MAGTSVFIDLVGRDNASATFSRVARSAETSSSRMKTAFAGAIGTAAKLGLAFGAYELVKKAIDIGKEASQFQKSMLLIQTQAGATSKEVASFSKALLTMSGQVAQSPEALATSLYHVYSTGLKGAQALKAVRIAAMGARIGNSDLEETTNALTSTVVSGIKGVKDMGQAMGALNTIVGTGDMKLSDLNEALGGGILSVAKGFGISLTEVGAALAVFGDNNIRGAEAATQLRMAVMAFAAPVKGGTAALSDIGIQVGQLKRDMAHGGLTSAVDDLNSHMKKAGITGSKVGGFLVTAFGRKAGVGLSILMSQVDRFHTKLDAIAHGAGSFGKSWQATTKTAAFAFSSLGNTLTAYGITVANKVLPSISQFVAQIGVALPGAISTAQHILAPFAEFVVGALTGAWHIFGGAISATAAVLTPIVAAIDALRTPLGAIALAAIAAVAGFKLFAAIPGMLETVALKTMYMGDAFVGFGTKAKATATSFVTSSAIISGTADATAADVAVAGDATKVAWAGILGPIGALALGIGVVVSMFGHSKTASKEATDAAKAYSDALSSDGGKTNLIDTITSQLKDNKVPQLLQGLNKDLGHTAFTGNQFVTAIDKQGKPLEMLRSRLEAVIKSGTKFDAGLAKIGQDKVSPAAQKATLALQHLNTQYSVLTKEASKELLDAKTFKLAASSIDKTTVSTKVGSDAAKQYATMAGIVVDKNGIAAVSSQTLEGAVNNVATAYSNATQTGNDFLGALDTFSKSSGTAADRAAMIGATLKANAGDALSFAAAMNGDAVAVKQLGTDIASASGADKAAADARKNHTNATLAAKDANLSFLKSVVDMKTGTINYNKAAAAPLINDLQSIQTSALAAAQASYQHNKSLMGGKAAADQALNSYVGVEKSLEAQFVHLGMTQGAAKKLTEQYLGVPKNVKTQIESEGADPVVTVLSKIETILQRIAGAWGITISVDDQATQKIQSIKGQLSTLDGLGANQTVSKATQIAGRASGGGLPQGWAAVGEQGPELVHTAAGKTHVYSNPQSKAIVAATGMKAPGFAGGTVSGTASAIAQGLAGLLSRVGLAGLLGNLKVESGFSPSAYNPRERAIGFAQWEGGRRADLQRYAALHHLSERSTAAQVGFLKQELTGRFRSVLAAANRAKTASSAAAIFDSRYEMSSGSTRKAREAAASKFYTQLAGGIGGTSTSTGSTNTAAAAVKSLLAAIKSGKPLADIQSALSTLVSAAHAVGLAVPSSARLQHYVGLRDSVNARLGAPARNTATAYDNLAAAKQTRMDAYHSVKAATSGFDITTAGQVYSDRPADASGILAALTAQASKATKFAALLKKMVKQRMPRGIVEQLAAAGPAAYDQAVALAAATPAQIIGLGKQWGALNTAGTAAGLTIADTYYKSGVDSAQGIVNGLLSQQKKLNATIIKLADGMTAALKKRLGIHSPSTVMRWHGAMAGEGFRLGVEDKFAGIEQAGSKIGNAAVPSSSSSGGGRTVHITQNISTDDPVAAANAALRRIQAHMVG